MADGAEAKLHGTQSALAALVQFVQSFVRNSCSTTPELSDLTPTIMVVIKGGKMIRDIDRDIPTPL